MLGKAPEPLHMYVIDTLFAFALINRFVSGADTPIEFQLKVLGK